MTLLDKFLDAVRERERIEARGGIWTAEWIRQTDIIGAVRSTISDALEVRTMNNQMNWALDPRAKCVVCGTTFFNPAGNSLSWGIVRGMCFCNVCDAPYFMRDDADNRVIPILKLRDAFIEPAIKHWRETKTGLDRLEMQDWIRLGVPASEFKEE